MAERLLYATPDFPLPNGSHKRDIITVDEDMNADHISFGNGVFTELVRRRLPDGSLKWANALFVDTNQQLEFYYDYNYWGAPFPRHLVEDPYHPYPAVIVFNERLTKDGRAYNGAELGSLHYDNSGSLRTIKGGSFSYNRFDVNVSRVIFQQEEHGVWNVFRLDDLNSGALTEINGKLTQGLTVNDNETVTIDEVQYKIHEEDDLLSYTQTSATAHKQKVITAPAAIDLAKWRSRLDQKDESWMQVLTEFPSSLLLVG